MRAYVCDGAGEPAMIGSPSPSAVSGFSCLIACVLGSVQVTACGMI
jgi:hypothetical protein